MRWLPLPSLLLLLVAGCVSTKPIATSTDVPARLDPADVPMPLSLDTAVRVALRNDPQIRAARHRVSERYWWKVQESLAPNPTIAISADPTEWATLLTVELISMLDAGGGRQHKVDAAQSREEQAIAEVLSRQIQVVQEVRTAIAQLLAGYQLEVLLNSKADITEWMAAVGRQQQAVGDISPLDIFTLESAARDAQIAWTDVVAERMRWEARLNRLLCRPMTTPVKLVESFGLKTPLGGDSATNLAHLGVLQRPEVAFVAAKVREHEALLSFAKIAWIPRVDAGPLFSKEINESLQTGGAVSITLPVFDHGQAIRKAESASLRSLQEELLNAESKVLLDVHLAVLNVRRAAKKESLLAAQASLAGKARQVVERARQHGASSDLEAALARLKEVDAKVLSVEAQRELWLSKIRLLAALGDHQRDDQSHYRKELALYGQR